jgi:hypothetical protein
LFIKENISYITKIEIPVDYKNVYEYLNNDDKKVYFPFINPDNTSII